jgi:hypothetical protein
MSGISATVLSRFAMRQNCYTVPKSLEKPGKTFDEWVVVIPEGQPKVLFVARSRCARTRMTFSAK